MTKNKKSVAIDSQNELVEAIYSAIKNRASIKAKSEDLLSANQKKERLGEELKALKEQKQELEDSIAALKESFGDTDSFSDMETLKKLKLDLEVVDESIPLISEKFTSDELNRAIRDGAPSIKHEVGVSLTPLREQLQEQLDAKIDDLLCFFSDIEKAGQEAIQGRDLVDKSHTRFLIGAFPSILPVIKVDKIKQYDDSHESFIRRSVSTR